MVACACHVMCKSGCQRAVCACRVRCELGCHCECACGTSHVCRRGHDCEQVYIVLGECFPQGQGAGGPCSGTLTERCGVVILQDPHLEQQRGDGLGWRGGP